MAIASRQWDKHTIFYVSDLPGHSGTVRIKTGAERNADWGYSSERKHAINLTPYWQRRFLADMRRVRAIGAKVEE